MKSKMKKKNITLSENKFKIRRIDEHYRFALDFFWENGAKFFESIKYDPKEGGVKIYRVGFVGFGEYAYEFLKVLCCLGQLPKCRLIIYIFDRDAKDRKARLQSELLDHCANKNEVIASGLNSCDGDKRNLKESSINELKDIEYHDFPFYEIHFVDCDVEKTKFLDNCFIRRKEKKIDGKEGDEIIEHFTHMFFMLGNDDININVATKVSIAYQRNPEKPVRGQYDPQFYVMVKNDDTTAQLREKENLFNTTYLNIQLIGANSERYSIEAVEESDLEKLGKQVHKLYSFNKSLHNKFYMEAEKFEKQQDTETVNCKKIAYELAKKYLQEDLSQHSVESVLKKAYEKILGSIITEEVKKQTEKKVKEVGLGDLTDDQWKIIGAAISQALNPIEWLFESERLEEDYNKREYYRRSSKSRALFEKLLCQLGYLSFDEANKHVKPNNVVTEFGVTDAEWNCLDDMVNTDKYKPKNIPIYKKHKPEFDANSPYSTIEKEKIIEHIDVQWFEVNNILQKRWMVFRWAEGYIQSDTNTDEEIDLKSKKHKYLRPYIEIYANDEMRKIHTIDVLIDGMANTYAKKIENQQTN